MTPAEVQQRWEALIAEAAKLGVLRFHHNGVAVLVRPEPEPPKPN